MISPQSSPERKGPSRVAFRLVWLAAFALMPLFLGGSVYAQDSASPDDESAQDTEAMRKELDDLKETVEFLEDQLFEVDERLGSSTLVKAFDATNLYIGGFITQVVSAIIDGGAKVSPNQTLFELLLKADLTDDVSVFTALGFLREADIDYSDPDNPFFRGSANRVPLIISWANYAYSDSLQVQAGRFVTPHGIINIEHFPPVLLDTNQPQFLRPFSGATIFPNFLNGVQLHGKIFSDSSNNFLNYNIYGGSFSGGSASDILSGARVGYTFSDIGTTVGINYARGHRTAGSGPVGSLSTTSSQSLVDNRYNTAGIDILFENDDILWKNEYFYSWEKDNPDRKAFYSQPGWKIDDNWITFYRFDYLDPGQGLNQSTEHVIGLNWLPISTIRTRLEYIFKDFENSTQDANIIQLSVTLSF